jgi:type I restriction enzyme, R subunit
MPTEASNFLFLKQHDVQLVRLGALAERYFHDDQNTCLIKLRQFGELLAQLIAAKTGLYEAGDESQADLLRRLRFERVLPLVPTLVERKECNRGERNWQPVIYAES